MIDSESRTLISQSSLATSEDIGKDNFLSLNYTILRYALIEESARHAIQIIQSRSLVK